MFRTALGLLRASWQYCYRLPQRGISTSSLGTYPRLSPRSAAGTYDHGFGIHLSTNLNWCVLASALLAAALLWFDFESSFREMFSPDVLSGTSAYPDCVSAFVFLEPLPPAPVSHTLWFNDTLTSALPSLLRYWLISQSEPAILSPYLPA